MSSALSWRNFVELAPALSGVGLSALESARSLCPLFRSRTICFQQASSRLMNAVAQDLGSENLNVLPEAEHPAQEFGAYPHLEGEIHRKVVSSSDLLRVMPG